MPDIRKFLSAASRVWSLSVAARACCASQPKLGQHARALESALLKDLAAFGTSFLDQDGPLML